MNDQVKALVKRLQNMETARQEHVEVWRKCYKYSYPLRNQGFYGEVVSAVTALADKAELNDSTTTEATRIFASHLQDGMTPSNALWFGLDVGQESDDEKRVLSQAAKFIWENIHASNFDSVAFESVIDALVAGWFVLYVDEAPDGGYHFEQWPIAECFIASSRAGAPVDTVFRKYKLTAQQAVTEYGDKVSEAIKKAIADGKDQEKFEFAHCIYPRKNYAVNARLAKNMKIASMHIECKTNTMLREGGYHEMPVIVPRWMLIPGTPYAVGAVFDALPEAATINKIREYELANMDMAIGGLWIAEDDGVLNPRNIKIGPRRVIVANSVDSMKELRSGADFNVAFMAEDRIQAQIRKILLADVLPPLEAQPLTATEINMRMQYIRQMLGPVFARLQSEYLQPLIERCFGIAYRAGVLGKFPDSLSNRKFTVKYVSPLARAQKLAEVTAIDEYAAGLAQMSALDPSVMDNINLDKAARFRGEALGVPMEIIPTLDEMDEKRAQRQQAQQQMQQEQIANQVQAEAGTAAVKKLIGGQAA